MKKPQADVKSDDDLYDNAGSNLITQTPEIRNWLQKVYPDKPLIVGCYVYLDGEAHVKVVLACDAIMKGMSESRKAGLAFLCTPTDAHVITGTQHKYINYLLFFLFMNKPITSEFIATNNTFYFHIV